MVRGIERDGIELLFCEIPGIRRDWTTIVATYQNKKKEEREKLRENTSEDTTMHRRSSDNSYNQTLNGIGDHRPTQEKVAHATLVSYRLDVHNSQD